MELKFENFIFKLRSTVFKFARRKIWNKSSLLPVVLGNIEIENIINHSMRPSLTQQVTSNGSRTIWVSYRDLSNQEINSSLNFVRTSDPFRWIPEFRIRRKSGSNCYLYQFQPFPVLTCRTRLLSAHSSFPLPASQPTAAILVRRSLYLARKDTVLNLTLR